MTDVNVKKQTSDDNNQALQNRESENGVSRRRGWDPLSFAMMPSDFMGTDPFSLMRRFHEEVDRTFGRVFGNETAVRTGVWNPVMEIAERDGQLTVHTELPGLKAEDVKVEVTEDTLRIQGERKYEHEDSKGGIYRSERRYGQFSREIPLPQGVNVEQAIAQFRDGVLEVTLPLPEQKTTRRAIPIESGSSGTSSQESRAAVEQK